jgi:hypothetical protein
VGLEFDMKIGSLTENMGTVEPGNAGAAQHCQFDWSVSERKERTLPEYKVVQILVRRKLGQLDSHEKPSNGT